MCRSRNGTMRAVRSYAVASNGFCAATAAGSAADPTAMERKVGGRGCVNPGLDRGVPTAR